MAEILIYNKTHWFDLETPERQSELNIDGKFDSRYIEGDFIEIREDGFWTDPIIGKGYNKDSFDLLVVDDATVEELRYLTEHEYETDSFKIKKLRKHKLDKLKLYKKDKDKIDVENKTYIIVSKVDLKSKTKDKSKV